MAYLKSKITTKKACNSFNCSTCPYRFVCKKAQQVTEEDEEETGGEEDGGWEALEMEIDMCDDEASSAISYG